MYALQGGARPVTIGQGKVDDYLRADLDEDHLDRVSSVADPQSGLVFWSYPGAGNVDGRPNRLAVFNTRVGKWGIINEELELIWRSGGVATTLEGLDSISTDLDALGISLDSSQWKGGSPVLAGFNSDFENGNFTGAERTAVLTTRETEVTGGRRTRLDTVWPMVDGGTITARIGSRNRLQDDVQWTTSKSVRPSGRIPCRVNDKYMRVELTISGEWSDAIGVRIEQPGARPGSRR